MSVMVHFSALRGSFSAFNWIISGFMCGAWVSHLFNLSKWAVFQNPFHEFLQMRDSFVAVELTGSEPIQ